MEHDHGMHTFMPPTPPPPILFFSMISPSLQLCSELLPPPDQTDVDSVPEHSAPVAMS